MIRFVIAGSGSKGNATFVYSETTIFQIDMGVTLCALDAAIKQTPFSLSDVQGLLVTHEHSDHVKGLSLAGYRKYEIPTYSAVGTLSQPSHIIESEDSFDLGDFTIIPLKTSHDANNPLGFVVFQGKEKLVYMTDTGFVPLEDLPYMVNADHYIFESNHDIDMLMSSNRPRILKQRIFGEHGHLNNEESASYLSELVGEKTKSITLAHLSEECNTPEKAIRTWEKVFQEKGMDVHRYLLRCAPQWNFIKGGDE